jgi:hypothetical protein
MKKGGIKGKFVIKGQDEGRNMREKKDNKNEKE